MGHGLVHVVLGPVAFCFGAGIGSAFGQTGQGVIVVKQDEFFVVGCGLGVVVFGLLGVEFFCRI